MHDVYMYVCVCMYTYTHSCIKIHLYIYIHIYLYTCILIHIIEAYIHQNNRLARRVTEKELYIFLTKPTHDVMLTRLVSIWMCFVFVSLFVGACVWHVCFDQAIERYNNESGMYMYVLCVYYFTTPAYDVVIMRLVSIEKRLRLMD